ncbi:MAG: hypothetical protein KI786_11320 [Mameliella sp.]|nr:hypothetical protein [Phaeodactylibacter sp.]
MYRLSLLLAGLCLSFFALAQNSTPAYHIRINQSGYLPSETKQAIVFSNNDKLPVLTLKAHPSGSVVTKLVTAPIETDGWGDFSHLRFKT